LKLSSLLLWLLDTHLRPWSSLDIRDFILGLNMAYVEVEGGYCGVAVVPRSVNPSYCSIGVHPTPRLLARAASQSLACSILAIALVNALTSSWIHYTPWSVRPVLASSYLERINSGDHVLLVGFMEKLAERLRSMNVLVSVLESSDDAKRLAERKGFKVLSGIESNATYDHVLASGTSIYDPERLRRLLSLAPPSGVRAIIGPTASFHPELARRLGANFLGGALIPRSLCEKVKTMVSLGYPVTIVKRYMVKWGTWIR